LPRRDTHRWRNVFTGEYVEPLDDSVRVAELFAHFPIALLLAD
jgi:maltooligosyltrehalose synthase